MRYRRIFEHLNEVNLKDEFKQLKIIYLIFNQLKIAYYN